MKKIDVLEKSARESATWRGHKLNRFSPAKIHSNGKQQSFARCLECGALAAVDTQPLPNDIDISGTAVALNCKGVKLEYKEGQR